VSLLLPCSTTAGSQRGRRPRHPPIALQLLRFGAAPAGAAARIDAVPPDMAAAPTSSVTGGAGAGADGAAWQEQEDVAGVAAAGVAAADVAGAAVAVVASRPGCSGRA